VQSVSVVVPVKDGERHLERVLEAVRQQGETELLVVDSGSQDRSRAIARAAGAEVIEIAPAEFGHGRTRNLAAARSSGDLICFLTQDAVPVEGWLDAYLDAFALERSVGAAFGPHLPTASTSPMIARDLEDVFRSLSPDGRPVVHRRGDSTFLSNVNACYARACWEEIRFADLDHAEDQAFGRAMLEAGWLKVFHPAAAVVHAHDYGPIDFMRRYFDEYRGLHELTGQVASAHPVAAARYVVGQVAADARWMRRRGWSARRQATWVARSALHHSGRKAGAALGSRAERLPAEVQRRLSLEGRAARTAPRRENGRIPYEEILRVSRDGAVPLVEPVPGMSRRRSLRIAVIVPAFSRGSGGHWTIFQLVRRLEDMGHACSVWLYDPWSHHAREGPAVVRRMIVDWFAPIRAPVFKGFDDWHGADVTLATGWDTVYAALLLPATRARAYLINDHEPDFFPASAEALWARLTYSFGFYGISAGRWLGDVVAARYGQRGTWFQLGVDHTTYHPMPVERQRDVVVFYARATTPRRVVPLGLLGLGELHRRRPDLRFVLYGQAPRTDVPFPCEQLGVVSPETLARQYSRATVGLSLSYTNISLTPQEMMACGLPCVELAGGSAEAEFGVDGPVELAAADPLALADAVERLLSDEALWERRSNAGLAHAKTATWEVAAQQVERALRSALAEREVGVDVAPRTGV
jgi:glycosyltransferase involved in cell wall biosynthesis